MDAKGKVILITGSTDGVGRMTAERLGAMGSEVLVHGRDADRGREVVAGIEQAGGRARLFQADLASLAEVGRLADAVIAATGRLDVLVNNAGIGSGGKDGRAESRDGHELRFAVNYLAGYVLARRLLPLVRASAPSRIVNVSSIGQEAIDFDDVMLTRGYSGWRAYCQSKLAQVLLTIDLADELKGSGVTANCLHPATYMNTTMVRQSGATPMSTVEQGCDAIMNLILADDLGTGQFFNGLSPARADAQAYDATARARLRDVSRELTGIG